MVKFVTSVSGVEVLVYSIYDIKILHCGDEGSCVGRNDCEGQNKCDTFSNIYCGWNKYHVHSLIYLCSVVMLRCVFVTLYDC